MTATSRRGLSSRVIMGAAVSICVWAPTSSVHAQQANAYSDLSQYLISGNQIVPNQASSTGAPLANLSSTVVQSGQNNTASAALNGTANITSQYQVGANNSSTLSINGAQNTIATTQIGSSNTTAIDVAGNGNMISNLQVGTGLSYQLQVIGKSAPVSVQQYGRK